MLSQTDSCRRGKTDAEIKQQWEDGYRELKGMSMQNSYDPKDVVVVIRTDDTVEGADFTSSIVRLGAGYIYGVVCKEGETDAEYE